VIIVIGEFLPPLQAFEHWMAPRREVLVWAISIAVILGWAFLIGGALYRIRTGGRALSRGEIEASVKSVKDREAAPYAIRVSRNLVPKKAWGAGFNDEVSIAQFKTAWRQGLWRRDPRWRGLFIMGLGALFMTFGGFGLMVVFGMPGLKLLFGGALIYAAARIIRAFLRA